MRVKLYGRSAKAAGNFRHIAGIARQELELLWAKLCLMFWDFHKHAIDIISVNWG